MEDCQDYDDQLKSANIYCFRVELSAEGAKRGVETPPEVFPPDNLPRPSRPKAGLGLVIMMMRRNMMMITLVVMMTRRRRKNKMTMVTQIFHYLSFAFSS